MIEVSAGKVQSGAIGSSIVTSGHPLVTASRSPSFGLFCLTLLTIALGYSVFHDGGIDLSAWNFSLLLLGLAGLAYWLRSNPIDLPPVDLWLRWAALLFPCFVAFQLIPLPLPLVRVLSPTRAQLFESFRNFTSTAAFVPLSISPATTFAYLLRVLGYTITFLLVRDIAAYSSERRSWAPVVPLLGIAGLEIAFGFLNSGSDAQIQGTYANKNHFAGLLEMALPLTLMYGIALIRGRISDRARSKVRFVKASLVLVIAALLFFGLLFSMSKMGFVSGLCGLFVMGAFALGHARIRMWKKTLALAGLLACSLFILVFFPPDELVQAFGGLFSGVGASTEGRWPIWIDTLHLIRAFPVFGCGLGNYETAFLKYQTAVVDRDFTFAHNDYLQLAGELGAVGCVVLAVLMLSIFRKALRAATHGTDRNTRYFALGCVGAITAIGLHSLADFNMYIPANAMTLAWICGISAGLPSRSSPTASHDGFSNRVPLRWFAIGISCLLVVYGPTWMLFENAFRSDVRAERLFCRFGICDTDAVLAAQTLVHGGTVAAVPTSVLVEALRRDAAEPGRWCDLGDAMLKNHETGRARYCFSQAVALGPNIPFMLARVADFHFALNENKQALELSARTLKLDTDYSDAVFSNYEKRGISVENIVRHGLPNDRGVWQAYLRRMFDQGRVPDAGEMWNEILSRKYADDKLAAEYVKFLINGQNYETAQQAWARYTNAQDSHYPASNRIFNGDFESDPTSSPFDWTIDPAAGASADFDREVHYAGARSLRLQFDGTQNVSNVGVHQTLYLSPGRYRFEAYVRTEGVSTDEGIEFNVADPEEPKRLSFTTEKLAGTNDWKRIEHTFQVPAGTGLVQVSVVRKPSLRFDNLIRGTVWIAQVSIRSNTNAF